MTVVQAGEVWYSMTADSQFLALSDGEFGCYAVQVEADPGTSKWRPVRGEPKVWLTIQQMTQYGWLLGRQDVTCVHCGRGIINKSEPNMGGPSRDNWVHDPGGFAVCHPQQGADSTRATPV